MGRKAASLKSKSVLAIPFPHDGPIFQYSLLATTMPRRYPDEDMDQHDQEGKEENRVALELLASLCNDDDDAAAADDDDDGDGDGDGKAIQKNEPSWTLTRNLCRSLRSGKSGIKGQLQAVQAYRSTILNWKQLQLPKNTEGASSPSLLSVPASLPIGLDESLARGLYRLFLEWSMSAQTPLPLRRALHSCMHTTLDVDRPEIISTLVLRSLFVQQDDSSSVVLWKDPLHSLEVATTSPFLLCILQTTLLDECIHFIYRQWAGPLLHQLQKRTLHEQGGGRQHQADDTAILKGLAVVKLLKTILQDLPAASTTTGRCFIPSCDELEALVLFLMKCPAMPTEGFNSLGIVYAKLHLQGKMAAATAPDYALTSPISQQRFIAKVATDAVQRLNQDGSNINNGINNNTQQPLSVLARLSIVQGIAATLDLDSLLCVVDNDNNNDDQNTKTTPLQECWKYSLHASQVATDAMDRWAALKGLSTLASRWKQCQNKQQQQQQQQNTDRVLDNDQTYCTTSTAVSHVHQRTFEVLIQDTLEVVLQAWENPPLRKLGAAIPGIFETLVHLLLPIQRQELCRTIMNQPLNRKGRYLALEILLPYFPANNNVIRADSLLEGVGDRGPNSGAIADLWIKLLGYSWNENNENTTTSKSFSDWTQLWVPSLSRALVEGGLSRRKQVAAFCIIRLLDWIKRTDSLQSHLSESMVFLLNHIGRQASEGTMSKSPPSESTRTDRVVWAHLELARQLHLQKVMTPDVEGVLAAHLPPKRLHFALTHESSSLRLAAFRSLQAIIGNAYNQGILEEAEMWKGSLPFSIKITDSKEYTANILQCLMNFLDRYSTWEATIVAGENERDIFLPRFYDFASDFVIGRLFLKLGAYPGTVTDKEEFSLMLLESLLSFVVQDHSFSSDNSTRNGTMFQRKRQDSEQVTMSALLRTLLQQEVFASMFSLLHSQWDGTRAIAFRVLAKLVVAAHLNHMPLPQAYADDTGLDQLKSRGLYLASSPRQREADTGSRLLAYIFISKKSENDRNQYLSELVDTLDLRLSEMKVCLKSILNGDPSALNSGTRIPLAHGIIHTILLTVQHSKLLAKTQRHDDVVDQTRNELYEKLLQILCEAIQLSLNIVADVRDGECVEGMEDTMFGVAEEQNERTLGTPLNVNTGAIGANGNFSKLAQSDNEAHENKLAVQRLVVGTWLLIKETCSAASAVIAVQGFDAPCYLIQKCGTLLISTLISLKHAGAAFFARDSIQEIAHTCLGCQEVELQSIPEKWVDRMLDEMCSYNKVRDSTLRRSTGYALGFLALMRSELATRSSNSIMCHRVLTILVAYSLPAENQLKSALSTLNVLHEGQEDVSTIFYSSLDGSNESLLLPDSRYEVRCRVHALNVLRMIILDAPLAEAVRPFIGDAIVSSLLGYSDPAWAVRNSATMVFSAAMLRAVDADKNASNTDETSSLAVTVTELFRRYPALSRFLPSTMEYCLVDQDKQVNSQLFPILQLLSRTQPVLHSGGSSGTQGYPAIIRKALSNKHHAIRAMAARSLANVCSDEVDSPSSFVSSLQSCHSVIRQSQQGTVQNWNQIDGSLLAISTMISSTSNARTKLFDLGIHKTLNRIIQLEEGLVRYPPSCISAAVDVLAQIASDRDQKEDLMSSNVALTQNGIFEGLAGGALVYESAAKAMIAQIQCDLWDPIDLQSFDDSLVRLQSLLTSKFIDVRLVAAKTFKKSIYKNIDHIVLERGRAVSADKTLMSIATIVLTSVEKEMQVQGSTKERLGPHIPTVRRLSRCFLECFDGYQRLNATSAYSFMVKIQEQNGSLWSTAMTMVEQEQIVKEPKTEPNGETFLSGNAAEMMSIHIAAELYSGTMEDRALQIFIKVICRLNDSHASWRSRFSAAKAIENSLTLTLPTDSQFRRDVLQELLEMLQDSDPDVRSCAARASRQLGKFELEEDELTVSLLPVPTLIRLYPLVYSSTSNDGVLASATIHSLLEAVLENSQSLVATLKALDTELRLTQNKIDPSTLTNISSVRKIFEEEDPNPFDERLLSNQLVVRTMLQFTVFENSTAVVEASRVILRRLCTALHFIRKDIDHVNLIHDKSRFPAVFPSLHTLLCATAASIFLGMIGDDEKEEIHRIAEDILGGSSSGIHPEIISATKCLFNARKAHEATRASLQTCLFLL